jgi:hypothetical protein
MDKIVDFRAKIGCKTSKLPFPKAPIQFAKMWAAPLLNLCNTATG